MHNHGLGYGIRQSIGTIDRDKTVFVLGWILEVIQGRGPEVDG